MNTSKSHSRLGVSLALSVALTSVATAGVNLWTGYGPPVAGATVSGVAVDPTRPTTVYAAAQQAGLFRSTDAGRTWSAITIDQRTQPAITTVAIDPVTPTTIYVGTTSSFGGGLPPSAFVYESIDSGETWSAADAGLPGGVSNIAIAPSQPFTIFSTNGQEIFKTLDGARTWSALNIQGTDIVGLAVDPQNPMIVFEADYGGMSPSGGIFKTMNGGQTWTRLETPLLRPIAVAIDPTNSSNIYIAGGPFAKSEDGGSTWTILDNAPALFGPILFDQQNPPVLFATGVGVFRTTDGGKTWDTFNRGLFFDIYSLAVDPSGTYLYVGTQHAGVFDFEVLPARLEPEAEKRLHSVHALEPR